MAESRVEVECHVFLRLELLLLLFHAYASMSFRFTPPATRGIGTVQQVRRLPIGAVHASRKGGWRWGSESALCHWDTQHDKLQQVVRAVFALHGPPRGNLLMTDHPLPRSNLLGDFLSCFCQIFPVAIRGKAMSVVIFVNRMMSGIIALSYESMSDAMTAAGSFFFFAALSAISVFFYFFLVGFVRLSVYLCVRARVGSLLPSVVGRCGGGISASVDTARLCLL